MYKDNTLASDILHDLKRENKIYFVALVGVSILNAIFNIKLFRR